MSQLKLVDEGTGAEHAAEGEIATIGRAASCDVVLDDSRISSIHGQIRSRDGGFFYQDLNSTNGSMVRSKLGDELARPGQDVIIASGDQLLLGDAADPVVLRFSAAPAPANDAPEQATVVAARPLEAPLLDSLDSAGVREMLALFGSLASAPPRADAIVERVGEQLFRRCPGAHLLMLEYAGGEAVPHPVVLTRDASQVMYGASIPASLRARALEDAVVLHATDLGPNSAVPESVVALGIGAALVAPLRVRHRNVGVLMLAGGVTGHGFSAADLELFAAVAYQVGSLVENARLLHELSVSEGRLRNENKSLRRRLPPDGLIGSSAALAAIRRQIESVAATGTTVMIQGETGTGKELVARALHQASERGDGPMLAINCGALARGTLESELFGHVRGAFTGADRDKLGLFEAADRGTLFLDEVGETPLDLQVKLLRVLEGGEITRVGAVKPRKVDVRIVCATNRRLEDEVTAGRFREDLYYRLNVFPLSLPPLRERRGDVPALCRHFLERSMERLGRRLSGFDAAALDRLSTYDWPGNIRELSNEVERAVLMAPADGTVGIAHLSPRVQGAPVLPETGSLKAAMATLEAAFLRKALAEHGGNRSATARTIGISRQALIAKIQRYGLGDLPSK